MPRVNFPPYAGPPSVTTKAVCPRVIHMLMDSLKNYDETAHARIARTYVDLLENDPRSARRTEAEYDKLEDLLLQMLLHKQQAQHAE